MSAKVAGKTVVGLRFISCFIVLHLLWIGSKVHSQEQATQSDIYTNIVGDWAGYTYSTIHGDTRHIPVEIVIKETKSGDGVSLDYTYAKKGDPDFFKTSKFMKLDLVRSEMILRWKGHFQTNEKYKVEDWGEFARTGLGMFTARGKAPGPGDQTGLFTFELGPHALTYKWLAETSGGSFVVVTTFSLRRTPVAGTNRRSKSY